MKDVAVTVMRPRRGWPTLNPGALWRGRDLLWSFVLRDVKLHYQQTILGPAWMLIQPLVTTAILAGVVGRIVKLPTDGEPRSLFYLTAIIMWGYFSEVVLVVSRVFITHEYLFSKVYFPRILIAGSILISNAISVALQFAALLLLMSWLVVHDNLQVSWRNLWIMPLSFLPLMAFSFGVGLVIASSTAKYRDLANITPFALQIGFIATPIVYPFSMTPPVWRSLLALLNPLSVLSDIWRAALTGRELIATPMQLALSGGSTLLVLTAGVCLFQYVERSVADTI